MGGAHVLTPVGLTGGPQWGVQVAFLFPRLSWSWSYFQSFILPHLMETVEKGSISERLLGLCLTETELGRNKQITVSRVRSCSLGQNHSGQQLELSVDQGGGSWHGTDEREQAHTSSPAPLPRWTLLSPDYLQAPQLSPWIFPLRRQSL